MPPAAFAPTAARPGTTLPAPGARAALPFKACRGALAGRRFPTEAAAAAAWRRLLFPPPLAGTRPSPPRATPADCPRTALLLLLLLPPPARPTAASAATCAPWSESTDGWECARTRSAPGVTAPARAGGAGAISTLLLSRAASPPPRAAAAGRGGGAGAPGSPTSTSVTVTDADASYAAPPSRRFSLPSAAAAILKEPPPLRPCGVRSGAADAGRCRAECAGIVDEVELVVCTPPFGGRAAMPRAMPRCCCCC